METKELETRLESTRVLIEGKDGEWRIMQAHRKGPDEWHMLFQRCDVFNGGGMACIWSDEVAHAMVQATMAPFSTRLEVDGVAYTVQDSAFR